MCVNETVSAVADYRQDRVKAEGRRMLFSPFFGGRDSERHTDLYLSGKSSVRRPARVATRKKRLSPTHHHHIADPKRELPGPWTLFLRRGWVCLRLRHKALRRTRPLLPKRGRGRTEKEKSTREIQRRERGHTAPPTPDRISEIQQGAGDRRTVVTGKRNGKWTLRPLRANGNSRKRMGEYDGGARCERLFNNGGGDAARGC